MACGTLYLIPCPISDETAPWEVLPASNREVMDALDYFIVENTRTARRFLSRAGIARPIDTLEFRELNEHTPPAPARPAPRPPALGGPPPPRPPRLHRRGPRHQVELHHLFL